MFRVDEDAKKKVYETFDRNEGMIDQDVRAVKKWMEGQKHLPEIMEDVMIKNFLLLSKCRVEKTKQKIDMYYTLRSLMPDLFAVSNPKVEKMQRNLDIMHVCVFPEPLDGIHRVIVFKIKERDAFSVDTFTMLLLAVFEIRLHEDFMFNDVLILDMENITLNDIKNMSFDMVKNLIILFQKIYSFRLKNIYFVNSRSFVSSLVALIKIFLKPKIFERVQVHKDAKILHEIFPERQIPADFGGRGPPLQELSDKMRLKLSEFQGRFDLLDKLRIDESLRLDKLNNDEIFGFYGNFKKLDVD